MPLPSFFGQETGLQLPKTVGICDRSVRSARFSAFCLEKGTHKGCPYRLSFRGDMPWEGAPQGAPLRLDYVGAHTGEGRAPTRGAPTVGLCGRTHGGGEGTHEGCPYGWIMWAHTRGGRAPTRGAPTVGLCGRTHGGGEGTHEGCPYGWIMWARTRGGEGTHEGGPYGWITGAHTGGGHPQGAPLHDSGSLTSFVPN